jgi:nucleoside-diphosphate-sugar epimerase
MRVFVTGATGFIGSALVPELLAHGHRVVGLARNDEAAARLAQWGVEAHRGTLADPDGLAEAARASDGVIHLAFDHDFSKFQASGEQDVRAVKAMAAALEGSNKPLVVTSGTLLLAMTLPPGQIGTELDATPESMAATRAGSELIAVAAAQRGVRTSVVRLPQVHARARQGLISLLIDIAREKGVAAYVGDGANRWPSAQQLDVARLYRLALERAEPGTSLHAVAEEGIALRAITEAIGKGLNLPVRSITAEEAPAHFGFLGAFAGLDNPTSSALTRKWLGWEPKEIGLLTGMPDYLANLTR